MFQNYDLCQIFVNIQCMLWPRRRALPYISHVVCAAPKGMVFGPFWSENRYIHFACFGFPPPPCYDHICMLYIYHQLIRGYYDLNTQLNKNITSEDEDENKMKVSIFESESKLFSVLKLSP